MRTSTGHRIGKYLSLTLLCLSLLALVSCNPKSDIKNDVKNDVKKLEETEQEKPMPKAIEYTTNERSTAKNVYLHGENVGNMKESLVLAKINAFAAKIDCKPVDATINSKTWKVTKGKVGIKVDVQKTLDMLFAAPEGKKAELIVAETMPAVTSQHLLKNIVVIGNYTTQLLNRGSNRVNNIDLAAEKIDFLKLSPGENFSFNKVIGRRTEAKGYEDAPIIIRTEAGPKKGIAVGGGICQVSTTLYNAIEECGMEMLERHLHSKDVGYVPKGEDATVSWGTADFRFRNSRSHPVMIRTFLGKKYLTVKILENRNS